MEKDTKKQELDKIGEIYQSVIIKGWESVYKYRYRRLFEYISVFFKGKIALELGCGVAESTQNLLKYFKAESIDVVDGSLVLLNKLKSRIPNINVIHSLYEDFKPQKTYDTIFMMHILEHLDEPELLLNNSYSWLNRNGVAVVVVPNALSIHRLVGVKLGLLKSPYDLNEQDIALGHKRVYDKKSMESLIAKSPYKIRHFSGFFFKPLSNRQIEKQWSQELIEAFIQLGFDFPEYCAELIFILEK